MYEKYAFFHVCEMKKSLMCYIFLGYFFLRTLDCLVSDCADAQAGLRLCCSQTPEDRISRVEAHIIVVFMIHAIVNELQPMFFFVFVFLNLIESSFSFVE